MQSATFKICIFGAGGVGKTTLVQRYITGHFRESTKMTIGADILIKELEINNWKVRLQIWDFGGEARFIFFLPPYAMPEGHLLVFLCMILRDIIVC